MHAKSTLELNLYELMLSKERQVTVEKEGRTIRMDFTLEDVFDRRKWDGVKIEYKKGV